LRPSELAEHDKREKGQIKGRFDQMEQFIRLLNAQRYGYPFDLKLNRIVLGGQTVYVGAAEITLYY